jgi:hypothetical protein
MMQNAPVAGVAIPSISAFYGHTAQSIGTSVVAAADGAYTYLCAIPGRAANGMYTQFIIVR